MKTKIISLVGLSSGSLLSVSTVQAQSLQWAKSIVSLSNQSKAIAVDASGNVYTTDSFTGLPILTLVLVLLLQQRKT